MDKFKRINSKTQYQSPFGTPPSTGGNRNNFIEMNNNMYMGLNNPNTNQNNVNMVNSRRRGNMNQNHPGNRRRIAYVVRDDLPDNSQNNNNNMYDSNNVGNLGTMNLNGPVGLGSFGFEDGTTENELGGKKVSH